MMSIIENCQLCKKQYLNEDLNYELTLDVFHYPKKHNPRSQTSFNICKKCFLENIDFIINNVKEVS